MEREILQQFAGGKRIKLTYVNGFTLFGVIETIGEDGIVFLTDQRKSYITYGTIASIVEADDLCTKSK